MQKRIGETAFGSEKAIGNVVLECFFDLGITVVYAVIVGFLIVGIVATDDGPMSVLSVSLYVLILPAAALLLIGSKIGFRLFEEWRAVPRALLPLSTGRKNLPIGCTLSK